MLGTVGRSLELYFIDGKPDGMQTAEVFNWTGHVLLTPRTRIKAALSRTEASHTGVYILLGEKDGISTAYIGEGENIGDRIRSHEQQKDWWTQAVLITTAANALNKAHGKYIESRLVETARSVGRRALENGNTPPRPGLSEAAEANMEAFMGYLMLVLPALRIDMFLAYAKSPPKASPQDPTTADIALPTFELISRKHDLAARAILSDDDFIVIAGSTARRAWEGRGTQDSGYAQLHAELCRTGVLEAKDGHCVFAADYAFRSPSAAAAVVHGRPANGTTEWKVIGTRTTYKDWEAGQLAASANGGRHESA